MNFLDDIYSNTTLVFSHFDISVEELNMLETMAMMSGEEELGKKISNITKNLSSIITIEEEIEERQLELPLGNNINIEMSS